MYENNNAEVEGTDLKPRDVRALTECMSVLDDVGRALDAANLYLVVSESGREYLVDAHLGMYVTGTPRVVATDGGRILSREVAEQVTDEETAAREERAGVTERERPDDCECWNAEAGLPCWACFRDGFSSQNLDEPGAERDE